MEIRSSVLTAFFQDLKTEFNNAYTAATPVWPRIAMKIDSSSEMNVYGWMEQIPNFREWIGTRVFHNIVSRGYQLTNRDWEWSVGVPENKIKDDQYHVYGRLAQMGGASAAYHPDIEVFKLLNNGFSDTCWDGKAFFAADHPWKPDANGADTTLDNLTNLQLNMANYAATMAKFKVNLQGGDNPFFAGTPEILLVTDPTNEETAKEILMADFGEFGKRNVWQNSAELLINAQVTAGYWFLLLKNNPISPFIFQLREAVTMESNEGTVDIRETKQYKLMADYRAAFGYTLPALAYGSTGGV